MADTCPQGMMLRLCSLSPQPRRHPTPRHRRLHAANHRRACAGVRVADVRAVHMHVLARSGVVGAASFAATKAAKAGSAEGTRVQAAARMRARRRQAAHRALPARQWVPAGQLRGSRSGASVRCDSACATRVSLMLMLGSVDDRCGASRSLHAINSGIGSSYSKQPLLI